MLLIIIDHVFSLNLFYATTICRVICFGRGFRLRANIIKGELDINAINTFN